MPYLIAGLNLDLRFLEVVCRNLQTDNMPVAGTKAQNITQENHDSPALAKSPTFRHCCRRALSPRQLRDFLLKLLPHDQWALAVNQVGGLGAVPAAPNS